jgi:hypothetical protein
VSNPSDLVSLAQTQAWAGGLGANDALTASLITAVSRQILSALSRPSILPTTFTETRDGLGRPRMTLEHYPVISVSAVIADFVSLPISSAPVNPNGAIGTFAIGVGGIGYTPPVWANPTEPTVGFRFSASDGLPPGRPQFIDLFGYNFRRGRQNVQITYVAGYQVSEQQLIPAAPYQVSLAQPLGAWTVDVAVVNATTGVMFLPVSGAPAAGQYSVSSGIYTFAAADTGATVTISYGYIPSDLANAAAQWVTELLSYQGRIGQRSKVLGGQETISYIVGAIPPMVAAMIQPYKRVVQLP